MALPPPSFVGYPLPWGEGGERSEPGEGSCLEFSEQDGNKL
jgi:hypothetical protein